MVLATLKDAFDRVMKKQKLTASKTQEMINTVLQKFETMIQSTDNATCPIDNNSPIATDYNSLFEELKTELKAISHAMEFFKTSRKDLIIDINKYSKLLEKHFVPDISKACRHMEYDPSALNLIIATHFYRQGFFDLGDTFTYEALKDTSAMDAIEDVNLRRSFFKLFQISEALNSGNLEPALDWAVKKHETGVELKLRQIQFVEILKKGKGYEREGLTFAKKYLQPLAFRYKGEVQKSMVLLLWIGRLDESPYGSHMNGHFDKVMNELKRRFCSHMGQCYECPLKMVMDAGAECLPVLLKLVNLRYGNRREEWEGMKELPVPVELGKGIHFHSVFVCPVLRERGSDVNPPMLMPCGHVISLFAILNLSQSCIHPFTCPYCPSEVEADQCRPICF